MKLTIENIKPLVCGAVQISEQEGMLVFRRFTEAQREAYRVVDTGNREFYRKTAATSGIRLEMLTDAEALSFRYEGVCGSSRPFCFMDLYIDDVLTAHTGHGERGGDHAGEARFELPAGEKKVALYFPNLYALQLAEVELEGATYANPVPHRYQLLCYGDSITQGYDAPYSSLSYANQLARELDAALVNKAIGGDVFFPELLELNDGVRPDIVTVAYGTNDWDRCSRDEFMNNMGGFMKKLSERYPAAKIFVITPIWRRGISSNHSAIGSFAELAALIRAEAEQYGFTVIDGMSLVPHEPGFFAADLLHPNDLGHLWYGRELAKIIKNFL